jgi:hypothetical protein
MKFECRKQECKRKYILKGSGEKLGAQIPCQLELFKQKGEFSHNSSNIVNLPVTGKRVKAIREELLTTSSQDFLDKQVRSIPQEKKRRRKYVICYEFK